MKRDIPALNFTIVILTIIFFLFVMLVESFAAHPLLQSGPMLGYSEMREVKIWVQTTGRAEVFVRYYPKNNDEDVHYTDRTFTEKQFGYTAHLIADEVFPGNDYKYEVYINGEKVEFDYPLEFQTLKDWDYKSEPPNFRIATGSCAFINDEPYDRKGEPYGGDYQIYESIYRDNPDMMLWLGDNVYYREADWNTKTGIYYRYTQVRSLPEMQPLMAKTHNYAIWDDHDYGPNNSDRSFPNKEISRDAFIDFWGNLAYGQDNEGVYSYFNWGDADFFLMDNRWFRTPNKRDYDKRELLGAKQIRWLIDNLISSKATFKFVVIGGQVLNSIADFETYKTYDEELGYLLQSIKEENIKGVVFLSGDRHFTELSALKREGTYTLYDLTCSALNSGAYSKGCEEDNLNRVEGTCYNKRNYALIDISGKRKDRKLTITVKDVEGNDVWTKEIHENELK